MTIDEKRDKLEEYCYDVQFKHFDCEGCKIKGYCNPRKSFKREKESDICRWYEMVFGEDAEQQEDQEREEEIASAIANMKWELTKKAFDSLYASKNYSVESEEYRIRMDNIKQACICLEILSRCEANWRENK